MLDDLLRMHDGVITAAQAHRAGLSEDAIKRRVRSGRWQRRAKSVYFVDDRPFTDAARLRTAVWGYGPRAAASGLAAAWWHGLTRFAPDIVEVTIPRNSHGRCHVGCRVRRRDLKAADVVERRDLRVTELGLTVVEAAVRRRGGAKIMDSALAQGAVEDNAHSEAERLLIRLLKANTITGWKANYPVAGYKVDVVFPKQKVAIEVDGLAFHSDSDDFHQDRKRQNAIALAGWQVLRFTWLDLTEYPERVIAEIKFVISAR